MVKEDDTVDIKKPEPYSEDQLKQLAEAWTPLIKGLGEWFQRVSKAFVEFTNRWFPVVSGAHRERLKIVRTEYHRRQKARRRRNRRR